MADRPRVLIVEHDVHCVEVLEPAMKNITEAVVTSSTGEALAQLDAASWDVVLVAVDVPGEGGLWLLERVAKTWPDTRRVLMSGARPPDFLQLQRAGIANDLVRKPALIEQVVSVVLSGPVLDGPTRV